MARFHRLPVDAVPEVSAPDDPVYKAKKEFIEANGLVVFRLHDHWQARKENDMVTGPCRVVGLEQIPGQT